MIPYRILIIDDSEQIRELLKARLTRWGHEVIEAENGRKGYEHLLSDDIHLVITDWMMPEMNGIQLCREVRETIKNRYVYIILLTARSSLDDLTVGIEAGADDFIAKPFHLSELQSRVNAGIRILELERQMLVQQKKLLVQQEKLDEAYQKIEKDLKYAARLQRSLLPEPCDLVGKFKLETLFSPSRYLAGDIFNVVEIDEEQTLVYLLDVSGKGVPAALLSFTLSKIISSFGDVASDSLSARLANPLETVTELNRLFRYKGDLHDLQYFTMIYAVINHNKREVRLVQAGHPPPVFMPREEEPRLLTIGGSPVGLWPPERVTYREESVSFNPSDRLYIYSDGVSEAFNADRECFSEERLLQILHTHRNQPLGETLIRVKSCLVEWSGKEEFDDDLTLCALEFY